MQITDEGQKRFAIKYFLGWNISEKYLLRFSNLFQIYYRVCLEEREVAACFPVRCSRSLSGSIWDFPDGLRGIRGVSYMDTF